VGIHVAYYASGGPRLMSESKFLEIIEH